MCFNNYKKIKGDDSYRKFFRDKKSNSIIVYAKKDKKINEVKKSTDIKSQGKDTYFQIFKVSIIFLHPNFLRLSQVYSQEH